MKIKEISERYRAVISIYAFLIIFVLIFSIFFPVFRTPLNISNILIQITPLALVAIGQTIVLIGGGIDLTVGVVISLTTVITANAMGLPFVGILVGLILVFVISGSIGFINGFLCNETNIPPIIITLAMASIIKGLNLLYRNEPGGQVPKILNKIIYFKMGIIPISILIVLLFYGIFAYFMSRSKLGQYIYAVGNDEKYSRMAGINIKKVRLSTYIICALMAGVTGIVLSSRVGSGSPLIGDNYLLDSITAVIVGGTGFSGGSGFILGTLGGATLVALMSNALNISNVSPFYQYIVKGSLLLIAMILNSIRKK